MHVTKRSTYALRGLAYLASRPPGTSVPLAEVAEQEGMPPSFLAKIFQELARHGLLTAERGRGSGYSLARPATAITVREIFEAVEGRRMHQRCLLWSGYCADDNPCPLHEHLKDLVPALETIVGQITLAQYAAESSHLAHRRPVPGMRS